MKRQFRNAITSLMISAFAGIGLMAFGQDPCCPKPVACVAQTCPEPCPKPACVVQPVAQPVVQEVVQQVQTCPDPCPQPVACVQPACVAQPVCGDPCLDRKDLVKRIEKNADRLRKHFKKSLKENCIEGCEADAYKESVREFERATDRLRKEYGDSCDLSGNVREVLDLANCISAYMDPCSLDSKASADWTALRSDLETLASEYCTTASFQEPTSLRPACVVQPVQVVQPVCCPTTD